jgi:organic hydroperoxide reductase OsmC/OhrA
LGQATKEVGDGHDRITRVPGVGGVVRRPPNPCAHGDGRDARAGERPAVRGRLEGFWTPEHLVVAAVESCFVLGLEQACEARSLPLHDIRVSGSGHVGERVDGKFGFQHIELKLVVEAPAERLEELTRVVRHVERYCVVSTALAVPVHYEVEVRASGLPVLS